MAQQEFSSSDAAEHHAFINQTMNSLVDQGEGGDVTADPGAPASAPAAPTPPAAAPVPIAAPATVAAINAPSPAPAPAAQAPAPTTAPAPQAVAAAPTQAVMSPAAKQALRAARIAEGRALDEVARLRAENERLKASAPPPPPSPAQAALERVRAEFPEEAAAIAAAIPTPAAAPTPAPGAEFVRDTLPPEMQAAVDEVPDLLMWQNSQEHQGLWAKAKTLDAYLEGLPDWANKPYAERFAEVARRINAEIVSKSAQPNPDPIASAPAAASPPLSTLTDLRGGLAPDKHEPNYEQMTNAQILASLDRLG